VPVEPLLVASMGSFGTVAQSLKPRIGVKTLLVRHKRRCTQKWRTSSSAIAGLLDRLRETGQIV
jgi:hypothetical protein